MNNYKCPMCEKGFLEVKEVDDKEIYMVCNLCTFGRYTGKTDWVVKK